MACAGSPDFWRQFHAFCRNKDGFGICPSLEARFMALDGFLESAGASVARQRLQYAWMKWGLSAKRGICPARPWPGAIPAKAVLVEGDANAKLNRKYLVELGCPYIFGYANVAGNRAATVVFSMA